VVDPGEVGRSAVYSRYINLYFISGLCILLRYINVINVILTLY
jgi:hypothetical protein